MPSQIDFDPSIDYYKALGVSPGASADDIKKAYRKLAKANHPDSTGGDKVMEGRFKLISAAYDVLGDAKKKAQYDQIRAGGFDPRMGGMPGGAQYTYTTQGGPGVFDLGDLVSQFFGQQGGPGGRVRVERMDFEPVERGGRSRTPHARTSPALAWNTSGRSISFSNIAAGSTIRNCRHRQRHTNGRFFAATWTC